MALYKYRAFSNQGKQVTGYLDASSVQGVKDQLTKQGMHPISITLADQEARLSWWRKFFGGSISDKDKILFTKQLALLLRSGIPLLQALELLVEQFQGNLRAILVSIKDDIKEGTAFADALAKYPKSFDTIYVQLVRAGEASGKLETILDRLTHNMERRSEIKSRVNKALLYPLIQLVVSILVVGVLMIWVVPNMAKNFAAQNQDLPGMTVMVIAISNFIMHKYILLLIFFILIVVAYRYWSSTPAGKRTIDTIKLKIPFIRYFARTNAVVQFSQTLGILLESGVNIAQALDIVVNIIDNQILKDTLSEARDKIIKQGRIAQYLKQTDIFPPIAIYLIQTGEQSGQLDTMLLTVASNYEADLIDIADGLSSALGPILLVVMAVIVGVIVMAIAVPITQMSDIPGI